VVRTEKGISQEELAQRSGLHRTYVSSVERGERNISLINIAKLANALGVKPSELMP
jgi:transcriptional regulator with XRE-family HTH domain